MASHTIQIHATAHEDIGCAMEWIKENASADTAYEWLNALFNKIATLEKMPERCPLGDC